MRAGEAARPPLPSPLPPGDRAVDRATQGRDFDALVRSENAPSPTGEATSQTDPATATTRPRMARDNGQSGAAQQPLETGDAMTGTLPSDAAILPQPSAKAALLPSTACNDAAVATAEPSDAPASDTLASSVQGDAGMSPVLALSVAADPSPLLREQSLDGPAWQGDRPGDAKEADAGGGDANKGSETASAAAVPSRSLPNARLATLPLTDAPPMPLAAPHASPPVVAIAGMGAAFPPAIDAASGDFSVPPSTPALSMGTASVDTLVPDLAVEVARHAAIGREEFLLRLRPADQGTILVRLQFQGDGPLRATITADNMAVLDMLRRDSDALASNLADAGVQTDARSFRFFGGDGRQAGGGDARSPFAPKRATGRDGSGDDSIDETIALYRPLRARAGLVNRLA